MQCDKCLQYRSNFREHNCIVDEIELVRKQVAMLEEALKGMCDDFYDLQPEVKVKYNKPSSHIAREALVRLSTMRSEEKK